LVWPRGRRLEQRRPGPAGRQSLVSLAACVRCSLGSAWRDATNASTPVEPVARRGRVVPCVGGRGHQSPADWTGRGGGAERRLCRRPSPRTAPRGGRRVLLSRFSWTPRGAGERPHACHGDTSALLRPEAVAKLLGKRLPGAGSATSRWAGRAPWGGGDRTLTRIRGMFGAHRHNRSRNRAPSVPRLSDGDRKPCAGLKKVKGSIRPRRS